MFPNACMYSLLSELNSLPAVVITWGSLYAFADAEPILSIISLSYYSGVEAAEAPPINRP